jgi:small subunit ribosomal protein S20
MPNKQAAAKAWRQMLKKREQNFKTKALVKGLVKSSRKEISAKNKDKAASEVKAALIALDKAAQKGVIKTNNAARRKSRLQIKLNALLKS